MISLIVCTGENNEIGLLNDMPWGRGLPADLDYFKKTTTGHPVVMGRKTFKSILTSLGKPLPKRQNIVLTRDEDFAYEGVNVIHDVKDVPKDEVFVIGGASVYQLFLPIADRLYITKMHASVEADTYFPSFSEDEWPLVSKEPHEKDKKNAYDYDFLIYERKK